MCDSLFSSFVSVKVGTTKLTHQVAVAGHSKVKDIIDTCHSKLPGFQNIPRGQLALIHKGKPLDEQDQPPIIGEGDEAPRVTVKKGDWVSWWIAGFAAVAGSAAVALAKTENLVKAIEALPEGLKQKFFEKLFSFGTVGAFAVTFVVVLGVLRIFAIDYKAQINKADDLFAELRQAALDAFAPDADGGFSLDNALRRGDEYCLKMREHADKHWNKGALWGSGCAASVVGAVVTVCAVTNPIGCAIGTGALAASATHCAIESRYHFKTYHHCEQLYHQLRQAVRDEEHAKATADSNERQNAAVKKLNDAQRDQAQEIAKQKNQITNQADQITNQAGEIKNQASQIAKQAAQLTLNEDVVADQAAKLERQEALTANQAAKLERQEELMANQAAKLEQLEALVQSFIAANPK